MVKTDEPRTLLPGPVWLGLARPRAAETHAFAGTECLRLNGGFLEFGPVLLKRWSTDRVRG